MILKEMNQESRPRERALSMGIEYATDAELLAILFGTGTKKTSAVELGQLVLDEYSLSELSEITIHELTRISGIGPAKALTVLAAFELFRRIKELRIERIDSPKTVFYLMKNELLHLKQEHFIVLYLDTQKQLIQKKTIFIGGLDASLTHPREVFKWAVKYSASSILLVHNHPSGNPKPSPEDIQITKLMIESGRLMGIQVVDHVIIGKTSYTSMQELGILKP